MRLKVEAVRDDGAVLVSSGRQAAALVTPDGTWVTTVEAARGRGVWRAPRGEEVIVPALPPEIISQMRLFDREMTAAEGLAGQ